MFMFKFMFKIKFKIKFIISSWILLAYSVIINIVFLYKLVALLVGKSVEELLVFFIEYWTVSEENLVICSTFII